MCTKAGKTVVFRMNGVAAGFLREYEKHPTTVNLEHPTTADLDTTFGALFMDVDELFFDGNTITPRPETNHMSIEAALRFLILQVGPKRTWIVHYSGHEDPAGPLSDEQLQNWVDREKGKPQYALTSSDIRVAKQGMLLAYEV